MENMYISLPVVLYILGIILLVILIILGIRILRIMNNVENIIKDVEAKTKSLNGVFAIIDATTNKVSYLTDKIVEFITNIILRIFKRKEDDINNEREGGK